eukprot:gene7664-820_t
MFLERGSSHYCLESFRDYRAVGARIAVVDDYEWADKYSHIMPSNVVASPYVTQYGVPQSAPAGMYNAASTNSQRWPRLKAYAEKGSGASEAVGPRPNWPRGRLGPGSLANKEPGVGHRYALIRLEIQTCCGRPMCANGSERLAAKVVYASGAERGLRRSSLTHQLAVGAFDAYRLRWRVLSGRKVSPEQLHRYLEMESHFLYRFVWGWQGLRERLLADPSFTAKMSIEVGLRERLLADPGFTAKMSIEVGIGICTKLTAESTKRAEDFMREIDFVAANVEKGRKKSKGSSNPVEKFFAGCPDNAFQKVPPGMAPFTVGQRSKAILRNGLKLLAVGFGSSLFGVGLTNSLVMLRFFLDPSWSGPPNDPQNVVATSLAYGVYMAVSSNLRYQIIAGVIEERGIEVFFAGNPRACTILSFFTRTSNTFLGSLLWVDFIRVLGMQKSRQVVPVEAASSLAFDIAELPAMCEDASNGMWQGMQDSLVAHPQIAGNVQGLVESHLACAVDPSSLGM